MKSDYFLAIVIIAITAYAIVDSLAARERRSVLTTANETEVRHVRACPVVDINGTVQPLGDRCVYDADGNLLRVKLSEGWVLR